MNEVFKTIKIPNSMTQDIENKVNSFTKKMFTPREITLDDILSK